MATVPRLLFAVASMLATGLSLTAAQILQPLKDASPVILALLANCVLVRLRGYLINLVLPLDWLPKGDDHRPSPASRRNTEGDGNS